MSNFYSARNTATDLICDDEIEMPLPEAIGAAFGQSGPGHSVTTLPHSLVQAPNLPTRSLAYRLGKRLFDLALAIAIAPLVGILIAIVGGMVLLSCGRPIFFRQRRIGQGGREFGIWKFRTMHNDADRIFAHHLFLDPEALHEWSTTHKLRRDPRTTGVGGWLRRTSLDELPQLFNIFMGDMSFVGPRPIVRAEAAKYGDSFSYYLAAVPGVTGLWQVSGRCNVGYKTRVMLDSNYVDQWSFWRDLTILLRTPRAVYRREGAY